MKFQKIESVNYLSPEDEVIVANRIKNQQILALESNKKIQKLENQLEEDELMSYNNLSEEINTNNYDDKVEQPPKKGFWRRLFGNNSIKRHAR